MDRDDIQLLDRYAKAGDAEAFSELVGRYQGFVYGTCLRVLDNAADAEDVAQECFLRLAKRAGDVRWSLAGWLHHNAVTMSIDEKRRQSARRAREEVHCQMNESNGTEARWEQIAPQVDQALDELPDDLRVVLVEHFLRRRTQVEVARDLDVSPATVSRRIDDGLDELRKKLKKAGLIVSCVALAALIAENTASAAPATLTASLGKLAISGVGQSGAAATTGTAATAAAAAGAASMTSKVLIGLALLIAAAAGTIIALNITTRHQKPREPVATRPATAPAEVKATDQLAIPGDQAATNQANAPAEGAVKFCDERSKKLYQEIKDGMKAEAAKWKSRRSVVEEMIDNHELGTRTVTRKAFWLRGASIRVEGEMVDFVDLDGRAPDHGAALHKPYVVAYDSQKDVTMNLTSEGGGFITPGIEAWTDGSDVSLFGERLSGYPDLDRPLPPGVTSEVCIELKELGGVPHYLIRAKAEYPAWPQPVTGETWICPSRGYTPSASAGKMGTMLLMEVQGRWQNAPNGMWILWEGTYKAYDAKTGKPQYTRHVTMREMEANITIPDERFAVVFPPGTKVLDRTAK